MPAGPGGTPVHGGEATWREGQGLSTGHIFTWCAPPCHRCMSQNALCSWSISVSSGLHLEEEWDYLEVRHGVDTFIFLEG